MISVDSESTNTRLRDVISAPNLLRLTLLVSGSWFGVSRTAHQPPTTNHHPSPGSQPLYGIDRTAVDAHLEVQGRTSCGRRPDTAQLSRPIDNRANGDGNRREIPVQRARILSMVHDHQVAEGGERVGVRHGAGMDGAHRRPVRRDDLDAVPARGVAKTAGWLSEPYPDSAGGRPVEDAAERHQRNEDRLRRCAA